MKRNACFEVERTCGDGACAIHAIFGSPSLRGLFKEGARRFYADQLGSSWPELAAKLGHDALLHEFSETLWYDVVKPQAQAAAGLDASEINLGPEEHAIFRAIRTDAVVLQNCLSRVRLEQDKYDNFQTHRDELSRRFRFLCRREYEDSFVRPLLLSLNILEDYTDAACYVPGRAHVRCKLDAVFEDCAESQRYRKNIVEALGVGNLEILLSKIEDIDVDTQARRNLPCSVQVQWQTMLTARR